MHLYYNKVYLGWRQLQQRILLICWRYKYKIEIKYVSIHHRFLQVRMQLYGESGKEVGRVGMFRTAMLLVKNEGPLALYKGYFYPIFLSSFFNIL